MIVQEHVELAPLTTLGVGGAARYFVEARSVEDVTEALSFVREHSLRLFVLGGGSNVVIADAGFDGLVLAMRIQGVEEKQEGEKAILTAGAGVVWDDFVARSVEKGLIGIECLSGIPGTVGGAVAANLGAYGAQCSDTFVSAEVLVHSEAEDTICTFRKGECGFAYHDSMFSHGPERYVVLQATFALAMRGTSELSYRDNRFDLKALATESGREPTPSDVRTAILEMRKEKGMVSGIYKSAGSFFHMPFVSAQKYEQVVALARTLDAEKEEQLRPWAWREPDGTYKIAGGFLLEYTDFVKGFVRSGAGISPKHTLSIINVDAARAADIAELARDMQVAVEKLFGIHLEREVEYVGTVECGK